MSASLAYYNEIDPAAAAVLRQLISDGVIAPGVVDTRSIKDVSPDDLEGFAQCHFFAGGGLWSVAARMAGWSDARPLWTASCPCQPFSSAGLGLGTDDPRHLWPDLLRLVRAKRPARLVGEQVAGAAGYGWLDGVRADLASEGYASRGVDIPACAVDAPHQRQRLYWLALPHADGLGWGEGRQERIAPLAGADVAVGYGLGAGLEGRAGDGDGCSRWAEPGRPVAAPDGAGTAVALGDGDGSREQQPGGPVGEGGRRGGDANAGRNGSAWADGEWVICHDGKARRAQPGIRMLVDGLPGRVDLWRIAGNAIVPVLAAEVIGALMDIEAAGGEAWA